MVNEKVTIDMITKAMGRHIEQGFKVPQFMRLHPYDMKELALASAAYFKAHEEDDAELSRSEIATLRLGTLEIKASILVKRGTVEIVNTEQLYQYDPIAEAKQEREDAEEKAAARKAYAKLVLYCSNCSDNKGHVFDEKEQRYKCGACGQ